MSMMGLTRIQSECLTFIRARCAATGIAPSYEEMKRHLRLQSKSGVYRIVNALEERGAILRLRGRARAIRPVEPDEGLRLSLPPELDHRLRLVASVSGRTPERVIVDMLRARLVTPAGHGAPR